MSSLSTLSSMEVDENPDVFEQGYDEQFEPAAPDVYECPICLLVLNKAIQTECGHRFCRGCILKVVREGRPNCPIDNEVLSEAQIFPDNFARREVLCLPVRCRNFKDHGCPWVGPLREIKRHMLSCDYGEIECPNNCGEHVKRSQLEKHKEESCQRRIVTCEYCFIKVVSQKLMEHRDRCNRFPIECPNGCNIDKIPREEIDRHMEYDCSKAVMNCPFHETGCLFQGNHTEIEEHTADSASTSKHMLELMKHVSVVTKSQSEDLAKLKKSIESAGLDGSNSNSPLLWSAKDSNIYKVEIEKLSNKTRELEQKISQSKTLTEMYRNEYKQAKNELETRIDAINQSVQEQGLLVNEMSARLWCGKFLWRITGFENLFRQAKNGDVPAVHSTPFYTGLPGYKMCLRINLNGIDSGANTHVSMFVHLMQGEFDSILDWPFPGSITLTIMDQEARADPQHVKETLTARPTLQAFLRPKTIRNHKGYGYVEMMPHSTLSSFGYVKEDTMVVRVDVKMPNR